MPDTPIILTPPLLAPPCSPLTAAVWPLREQASTGGSEAKENTERVPSCEQQARRDLSLWAKRTATTAHEVSGGRVAVNQPVTFT